MDKSLLGISYIFSIAKSTDIDFDLFGIQVSDAGVTSAVVTTTTFTFPTKWEVPDPKSTTPLKQKECKNATHPILDAPRVTPSNALVRAKKTRRLQQDILKDDYAGLWYWSKNKASRAMRLWGSV